MSHIDWHGHFEWWFGNAHHTQTVQGLIPARSSSVRFYDCLLLLTSTLRTAQLCIGIARPRALGSSNETNSAVVGCTRNCLVLAWIEKTWNNWISDNLGDMEAKDLYHLWSVELFNLASQLVDHQAIMKQDRFSSSPRAEAEHNPYVQIMFPLNLHCLHLKTWLPHLR